MKGHRPKNEPAHRWSKEVLEHPLLADLRTFVGMLSDHYAHFTPEFEGSLSWSEEVKPEENFTIFLEYFDTTKRTIHCAFVNLAAIHLKRSMSSTRASGTASQTMAVGNCSKRRGEFALEFKPVV